jgi:hypothetical protein
MSGGLEVRVARLEERGRADKDARKLQASEYQRRLSELNHAHEEARRVLGTYLPRETWEAWLKEEAARREKADAEMGELREQATNAVSAARATAAANTRNLAVATLVLGIVVLFANGQLP